MKTVLGYLQLENECAVPQLENECAVPQLENGL